MGRSRRTHASNALTTDAQHIDIPQPTPRPALPRSVTVWAAFGLSSAVAIGLLWLLAPVHGPTALRTARDARQSPAGAIVAATTAVAPRIAPRDTAMARAQWHAIVIHDSGSPAGDVASIERRHIDSGLSGLGYHFVIGNGQGLDDGQVAVGYRWEHQLPGAHAAAGMKAPRSLRTQAARMDATALNRNAIGICLVGNGERRPFTERQVRELVGLVRALQAELGIGADAVFFHTELVSGRADAGHFALAEFRAQLLP
jgi:hypothetical protein